MYCCTVLRVLDGSAKSLSDVDVSLTGGVELHAPRLRVYNRTENPFTQHQLVQVRLARPALGARPARVRLTYGARNLTLELGAIPREYMSLAPDQIPDISWRRCEPLHYITITRLVTSAVRSDLTFTAQPNTEAARLRRRRAARVPRGGGDRRRPELRVERTGARVRPPRERRGGDRRTGHPGRRCAALRCLLVYLLCTDYGYAEL